MSINECLEIFKEKKTTQYYLLNFFYLIFSNISNQSNTILISPRLLYMYNKYMC